MSADVIRKAFSATEEDFLSLVRKHWLRKPQIASVGSCLVGIICGGLLYVANAGDSRAVLGILDKGVKDVTAVQMCAEHNAGIDSVREELHSLHPEDPQIVLLKHNVWRVKGIIQLMVATTLVLLCTKPLKVAVFDKLPWLLTVPSTAISGREITMSAVREWAASQNSRVTEAVAVNNLGKWKTATQMAALTTLLATRDSRLMGAGFLVPSGVVLLYISSVLAVWSLAVYTRKIWRILLK